MSKKNKKNKKKPPEKEKTGKTAEKQTPAQDQEKMPRKVFDRELRKLQTELCHLQEHVKKEGLRVIVIFEGRDAAEKGGIIKRITERVSPRVFRVVALPAPNDRQKTQWYPQRYIEQFPAAGEVVIFDRSWYNRAGVEKVMGFCTPEQHERFLRLCPAFEEEMIHDGIHLIKCFFDVSPDQQEARFRARATDPMRHWKLSPMDVESWRCWWDYTAAYQQMLDATDTEAAPWHRVQADDKRRARLNCISHLLSTIPYQMMDWQPPEPGKKKPRKKGTPERLTFNHDVPARY